MFLCAIVPEMQSQWAQKMRDILKHDGELMTLMFWITILNLKFENSVAESNEF